VASWSVVFPSVAAIVTYTGGILFHTAIVAREFGIPAVVASDYATSRLPDGQPARTVRIVPSAPGSCRWRQP
jgi:phosphoenolpyruvate synthase/pyruvate phosphate dikinase